MADPDTPEKVPPTVLDTPTPAKDFSQLLQVNPKSPEQLGVEPLASDTSKANEDNGSKSEEPEELEFSSVCPSPSPANEEPLKPEDLNEDSIPPTQPEPKEMEEEAGEGQQHHILDELLTRHQQDIALGKNPGKGRKKKDTTEVKATQAKTKSSKGRGRGRGKGRGRGSKKAVEEEEAGADMNPDEENFSLLKAEPELWIDSDAEAEPASKTDKQQQQQQAAETPAPKPKARKGKKAVKAESGASASSQAPRAKAKASAKGKAKTSSKGDKAKEGLTTRKRKAPEAGTDTPKTPKAKAKAVAGKSPKAKAAAKALAKKSKAGPKADPEAPSSPSAAAPKPLARKPKVKMNQPFKHSTIVPYWSRQAIALKVQTGLGVSGLTQAWYILVHAIACYCRLWVYIYITLRVYSNYSI